MANPAQAKTLYTLRRHGASWTLVLFVTMLSILGLVVLFSTTQSTRSDPFYFITKQTVWFGLAIGAGLFAAFINLDWLRKFVWPLWGASLLLLGSVLIFGREINGAQRWLHFGPVNVQVSDFAKIALVFVLAHFLHTHQRSIHSFFKGFVIPGALVGVVAALVILQPDYGTSALICAVGGSIMFLAGCRLKYLVPSGALGLTGFINLIVHNPERFSRITAFLDMEAHKSDEAWQLWQGVLAFGVGGVDGVGLGNGRQQMSFLPEAHTDFIFPIIGEELGLIFTGGVVMAFMGIFLVVLANSQRAPNLFQFLLVTGCLLTVIFQALINCGVTTGLLPTKGMSLPFISYGGSNLICMFLCVGIIINCFRTWNGSPLKRPLELDL